LSGHWDRQYSDVERRALPSLNQLFDKVLAVPGVSDALNPTVDALKVKLVALAT